eukprot:3276934-Pyramimonas_sp.AAC.1
MRAASCTLEWDDLDERCTGDPTHVGCIKFGAQVVRGTFLTWSSIEVGLESALMRGGRASMRDAR